MLLPRLFFTVEDGAQPKHTHELSETAALTHHWRPSRSTLMNLKIEVIHKSYNRYSHYIIHEPKSNLGKELSCLQEQSCFSGAAEVKMQEHQNSINK